MYGTGLGGMGSGNVLVDCLMYITLGVSGRSELRFLATRGWASHGKMLALGNGPHFQYAESYFGFLLLSTCLLE